MTVDRRKRSHDSPQPFNGECGYADVQAKGDGVYVCSKCFDDHVTALASTDPGSWSEAAEVAEEGSRMKIILLFSTNVAAVTAYNTAAACCSPRVHRSAGSRTLSHDGTEVRFMTDLVDSAGLRADCIVRCSRLDVCPSTWFARVR